MRIQVIVNPRAKLARDEKALSIMKELLGAHLAGVTITSSGEQALDIALQARMNQIDTLVIVGGDGTLNAVLKGLVETPLALAIIPNGTANDLASFYSLPGDVATACDVILERRLRPVDVIAVNGRFYATGGGLGLPCRIAERANSLRRHKIFGMWLHRIFGSRFYVFTGLWTILRGGPVHNRLRIRCNGRTLVADVLALMINNQPSVGKYFRLAPHATGDDGRFDICLIESHRTRTRIVATFFKVLSGGHTDATFVKSWSADEIHIDAEEPLGFFADGEVLFRASTFTITLVPAALNIIVPSSARAITAISRRNLQARHSDSEDNPLWAA